MNEETLNEALKKYDFYHIIKLIDEIETPGNPIYVPAQKAVSKRIQQLGLKGKRGLDIGCRDGLFSFEAEKLGGTNVVGIDNELSKPFVEFLVPYFDSKVQMHEMNVNDLTPEQFGPFDVVIFPGVTCDIHFTR